MIKLSTMKKTKKTREGLQKKTLYGEFQKALRVIATHKKWLFITTGILVVILASVVLFSILTRPVNPVIAFYQVPKKVAEAITTCSKNPELTGETQFSFLELDNDLPLAPQLKKHKKEISLLFAPSGHAAAATAGLATAPPQHIRRLLPTTIRSAGNTGKTVYALPILMDHFELAYNKAVLSKAEVTPPKTITEMLNIADSVKSRRVWPFIVAGSHDEDLVLLVGTLLHAKYGIEAYQKLVSEIRAKKSFNELLEETELASVLETLLTWRRSRLLHPQWLQMTYEDIESFIRFDSAAMVFMRLSTRRKLDEKIAEKYEAAIFPNETQATSYPLTGPVYLGIRLRNELFADSAANFLHNLVTETIQTELSKETGLVPVNAKAPVNDRQAYDVRYWAASSRILVPDPVTAAIDNPQATGEFAQSIRAYIRDGGKLLNQ